MTKIKKAHGSKYKEGKVKVNVVKSLGSGELEWSYKEYKNLTSRILRLRKDQVAALLNLVGLDFSKKDINDVAEDILKNSRQSGHLDILIYEANSKEDLLWWIDYFEKNYDKLTLPHSTHYSIICLNKIYKMATQIKKDVYLITWRDAAYSFLKKSPAHLPPSQLTVGFIFKNIKEYVGIATNVEFGSGGAIEPLDGFLIPRKSIIDIKKAKIIDNE